MFNFKEGGKRIWHITLLLYYLILSPTVYDFIRFKNPNDLLLIILLLTLPFILKAVFDYIVEGFRKKK
jgi:hypothetical protein